jgi:hypothetical protein
MDEQSSKGITGHDLLIGLTCYYLSSLVVVVGAVFGADFLRPPPGGGPGHHPMIESLMRYDALHYKSICLTGYQYDPNVRSEVAFFPAYPLAARGVMKLTGCSPEWALLSVAHLSLILAFIGLHAYARLRYGESHRVTPPYVLVALALLPLGFFFRMGYSESLFVCVCVAVLLAMRLGRSTFLVAILCGLATAVRPVGVAVVPAFVLWSWSRSETTRAFFVRSLYLVPLASWGLLAYMAYQYCEFGDALAFAKTQYHWRAHPDAPLWEKARALLMLEPPRGTFSPSSSRYWADNDWHDNPLFSLTAANPIYFGLAAALILLGAVKRWLNGVETLLGFGLLVIPYLTRGYDNSMYSAGRFAIAVVPTYLVLGQLLSRCPAWLTALLAALGGFMLGAYAALFAAGYLVF